MANSKESPTSERPKEKPSRKEAPTRSEEREKKVEKAKEKEEKLSEEEKLKERKKAIKKSVEKKAPEVEQEEVKKQEKEIEEKGDIQKHFKDLAIQDVGKALGSIKGLSAYEIDEAADKLCEDSVFDKLLRADQIDYPRN